MPKTHPCGNTSKKSGARCVRPNGHSGHCCSEWRQTTVGSRNRVAYVRERFARPQAWNSGMDMQDETWEPKENASAK